MANFLRGHPRQPYQGTYRRIVVAFDVGTTYSGISFAVLDPGIIPEIQGVTRFPAQQKVGGDSKIPSVIYYDRKGGLRAIGAEALLEGFLDHALEEDFIKVEWFKLHLRPRSLSSSHISDTDLPPLPAFKTAVEVLADFLQYLYQCVRTFIQETYPGGSELWATSERGIEYILSLPNGWEGAQQAMVRKSMILAGVVGEGEGARVHFVTEGEASLHFCVNKGLAIQDTGVIVVDAGGGTIDMSAYSTAGSATTFEEIAPSQCRLQGSMFVSRRARAYLEEKLRGSRYGTPEDVNLITSVFDQTTKLTFRSPNSISVVRFGSARDKDPRVGIVHGQLKIMGQDIERLFQPAIQEILNAIQEQREQALRPISTVLLVGGFAASDYVFGKLQEQLGALSLVLYRPDGHLNKAVADGAVSFYLDHFVSARVSPYTYGVECCLQFDPNSPEHTQRAHTVGPRPSGRMVVPNLFSPILKKGTRVSEDKEFREEYHQESLDPTYFKTISIEILCYRGRGPDPKWIDNESAMFSTLCTVIADTAQVVKTLSPQRGKSGKPFYSQDFSIVLLFGLTELKAQLSWYENGVERRGPAMIMYDQSQDSRR